MEFQRGALNENENHKKILSRNSSGIINSAAFLLRPRSPVKLNTAAAAHKGNRTLQGENVFSLSKQQQAHQYIVL